MDGSTIHLVFETDRLLVRHYTEADADNFFLLNGDPEVMRYIRPVKSREETDIFLAEVIQYSKNNPAYGRMAVIEKQSDIFVGSFAIIPLENTQHMQVGYSLLPPYWGKGFATELTKAGLKYVFSQTNLEEIFGVTESENIDSQKVLIKNGFVFEKKYKEDNKELNLYRIKCS
jgi:[ribosomal protein S5]-alanine N-acetyltransferase